MTDRAFIDSVYEEAHASAASMMVMKQNLPSNVSQPFFGSRSGRRSSTSARRARLDMESQFKHYRGRSWSATRVLAQRIAGRPFHVARRTRNRNRSFSRLYSRGGYKGAIPTVLHSLDLERWELDDNHGIARVMREPNRLMVQHTFVDLAVQSLMVTGQAFWVVTETDRPGYPFDLLWIPSTWMQPLNIDGVMSHWRISPPGIPEAQADIISDEFVIRPAFWHPSGYGMPLSPLSMLARAILNDEAIAEAQHNSFHNGGRPGMAVIIGPDMVDEIEGYKPGPVTLTPDQREDVLQWIDDQVSGIGNEDKPVILDSFIRDVKILSHKPREMSFLESAGITAEQIFEGIGVPPVAAGQVANVTRDSSSTADGHLANNAANPIIALINQTMTKKLFALLDENERRVRIGFDEVVVEDESIKNERMAIAVRGFAAMINDQREFAGLPRVPGGDCIVVPAKARLVKLDESDPYVALPDAMSSSTNSQNEQRPNRTRQLTLPWNNGNTLDLF